MRDSAAAKGYKAGLEVANRNLKKLSDAGVRIAFGTDTGPPARFQGYFEHLELEMMVKAGLTPQQALNAATGDAARCMKVTGQVGTLERGDWADFLVLGANPLTDIHNTKTLESVWIGAIAAGDRLRQAGDHLFRVFVRGLFLVGSGLIVLQAELVGNSR